MLRNGQSRGDPRRAARPVTGLAKRYPAGTRVPAHRHRRGQLVHAESGVMRVTTREGIWIVPPARALWLPVGMLHEVRMEGDVEARTLYLDRSTGAALGPRCRVLEVSRLLRELVLAAVEACKDRNASRLALLLPLLRHELSVARETGMCIQMPKDPRLLQACLRLVEDPSRSDDLEQIARRAGASSRTLARLFERELKTTFGRWRQHLRLASALSRIAAGASIKSVAREAGYRSCSAFSAMFRRVLGVPPTRHLRIHPARAESAAGPR
jgi:AraC-like DNA-binding protein